MRQGGDRQLAGLRLDRMSKGTTRFNPCSNQAENRATSFTSLTSTLELHTPTMARAMPKILTLAQLLGYEPPCYGGKLAYFSPNTQTPCPRRGAVPVNQVRCRRIFHSQCAVRFG